MCENEKKVKSFNLTNEAIEVIENYKKENRLGNNSVALEKILLDEFKNKSNPVSTNEIDIRKIVEEILMQKNIQNVNEAKREDLAKELTDETMDEVAKSSLANMQEMLKQLNGNK